MSKIGSNVLKKSTTHREYLFGDFDKDTETEFAVGYYHNTVNDGCLVVFHYSGGTITRESTTYWQTSDQVRTLALLAFDYDKDNLIEILVGGYNYEITPQWTHMLRIYNMTDDLQLEANPQLPITGINSSIYGLQIYNETVFLHGYNGTAPRYSLTGFITSFKPEDTTHPGPPSFLDDILFYIFFSIIFSGTFGAAILVYRRFRVDHLES